MIPWVISRAPGGRESFGLGAQALVDRGRDALAHVGEAWVPGLAAQPADVDLLRDDGDLEGPEDPAPEQVMEV